MYYLNYNLSSIFILKGVISINKKYSIKKNQEIEKIIKEKNSVGNKYFVIYRSLNKETTHFRFALSVGKKFGIAVKRNLMKRRIREIIRKNSNLLQNDMNYIFVIKPSSNELDFLEIEKNIIYLLKKGENK